MSDEKNPKALRRRDLLKLGAAAGMAIPVVMSLAPQEARAEGSWRKNGQSNEWRAETREAFEMKGTMQKDGNQGFVFPGSYEWREKKRSEEERRRKMRGDFNRFGSSEG